MPTQPLVPTKDRLRIRWPYFDTQYGLELSTPRRCFQFSVYNGSQHHGRGWLPYQFNAVAVRLPHYLVPVIATDQHGRNTGLKSAADFCNLDNSGGVGRQAKVADDEVGHSYRLRKGGQSRLSRMTADHLATPAAQQRAGAVQHQWLVVDYHDKFAYRWFERHISTRLLAPVVGFLLFITMRRAAAALKHVEQSIEAFRQCRDGRLDFHGKMMTLAAWRTALQLACKQSQGMKRLPQIMTCRFKV